jgi:DNA-binding NarL/FixJ family response regulator
MRWTIALADEQPLFRHGLELLLGFEPDLEIVGEAATAAEARALAARKPSLLIIDVTLGDANGIRVAKDVMALSPRTRVLVLTTNTDESLLAQAIDAGIAGFAFKTQSLDELMAAIRAVARGGTYLPARYAHLAAAG